MRKVFNASAVLVVVGAAIVVAGLLLLDLLSGNGVIALICISMGLLLQLVVLAYLTGAGISTLVRRLIAARGGERDSRSCHRPTWSSAFRQNGRDNFAGHLKERVLMPCWRRSLRGRAIIGRDSRSWNHCVR